MNRPYQNEALNASITEYNKNVTNQLLVMATGTGKTHVFSQLPETYKKTLPGQMMVLAHREELIDQAVNKLQTLNPTLKIGKEMASHKCDPSIVDCIVAGVATLGRKGTQRVLKFNWDRIDKFVVDEAHHSPAQSYQNIFECAGVLEPNSKKLLLGVTATPNGRGDGKALAAIYKKIVYSYSLRQAITDGWLADVKALRVHTQTSLDDVKTVAGDFDEGELADAVNNPERNQLIYKYWKEKADGRQTIGFTVDIQHAKDLAAMFEYYGVKAQAVWGNDPFRKEKLEMHKNGELQVLFNCGILTEGYDDSSISCILMCRPTKSMILFTQMIGRGTRLHEGKADCIVIDFVDSSTRHTLVTLPTLMGMGSSIDLKGRSLVKSIELIEQMQEEYPNIDFSTLKDISKIEAYVEEVGLFDIRYPDEVKTNSDLSWHGAADGGFVILMPDKDEFHIRQNLLDQWEIEGRIKGIKYKGHREKIEDAFAAADNLILSQVPEHLTILKQDSKWHKEPATVKQMFALRRYYRGKKLPDDLTKGMASRLIADYKARKAK